jgi:hypothetical protein
MAAVTHSHRPLLGVPEYRDTSMDEGTAGGIRPFSHHCRLCAALMPLRDSGSSAERHRGRRGLAWLVLGRSRLYLPSTSSHRHRGGSLAAYWHHFDSHNTATLDAQFTFRTLFPGAMRVLRGAPCGETGPGYIESRIPYSWKLRSSTFFLIVFWSSRAHNCRRVEVSKPRKQRRSSVGVSYAWSISRDRGVPCPPSARYQRLRCPTGPMHK